VQLDHGYSECAAAHGQPHALPSLAAAAASPASLARNRSPPRCHRSCRPLALVLPEPLVLLRTRLHLPSRLLELLLLLVLLASSLLPGSRPRGCHPECMPPLPNTSARTDARPHLHRGIHRHHPPLPGVRVRAWERGCRLQRTLRAAGAAARPSGNVPGPLGGLPLWVDYRAMVATACRQQRACCG
jgi:hypothetical protein